MALFKRERVRFPQTEMHPYEKFVGVRGHRHSAEVHKTSNKVLVHLMDTVVLKTAPLSLKFDFSPDSQ